MVKRSPKTGKASHDWEALKLEWLSGDFTLKQFAASKGILNETNFYRQVKKSGWVAARARLEVEIAKKVEAKLVAQGVKDWEEEVTLLKGIRAQVAHALRGRIDKDGNVIEGIPAQELKALAEVVAKSVVAKKHIRGEPVEGEGGGKTAENHLHLHAHMVQVINEIEADGDGPTPLTPPVLGHQRGG